MDFERGRLGKDFFGQFAHEGSDAYRFGMKGEDLIEEQSAADVNVAQVPGYEDQREIVQGHGGVAATIRAAHEKTQSRARRSKRRSALRSVNVLRSRGTPSCDHLAASMLVTLSMSPSLVPST